MLHAFETRSTNSNKKTKQTNNPKSMTLWNAKPAVLKASDKWPTLGVSADTTKGARIPGTVAAVLLMPNMVPAKAGAMSPWLMK